VKTVAKELAKNNLDLVAVLGMVVSQQTIKVKVNLPPCFFF
jgi:hypothetical protein